MASTFSTCADSKKARSASVEAGRLRVGGELITEDAYRERERRAKRLVRALGLEQSWVATQIGRARETVCKVLNGRDRIPKREAETLYLIELLVACVEAGEVGPS